MSIFKKIAKGALSVLAPVLNAALPGPLGDIAKTAITTVLGINPEANEKEIEKALATASPEVLLALRDREATFKTEMRELGIKESQLHATDRADARQRHIKMHDVTPAVMGWTILVAWVGVTGLLFFYVPPGQNKDLILITFGMLSTMVGKVTNFYFGSSVGSRKKDDQLAAK